VIASLCFSKQTTNIVAQGDIVMRKFLLCVSAAIALCAVSAPMPAAAASDYPNRPIKLVVPYPPGGTSEVLARSLARRLGEALGEPVVLENVGGAGSTIGTAQVARAAPDGYTLLFGYSSGLTIAPGFYSKLGYDTLKAFTPVASVGSFPMLMAAGSAVPVNNLRELVALAKKEPGKLTYGTAGVGTSVHLMGEILRTTAGIDIRHVPYKGMAPALLDVAAGRVDLAWDAPDGLRPLLQQGKVKPLAVTSSKRLRELPNVPTVAEAGFPDLQLSVWTAIVAPAGTPPDIVAKIEGALHKVLDTSEMKELFESRGYQLMNGSSASLGKLMKDELARYADVIRRADAKID
jgi:tripartite-type tricarboxylate transporter receptor subunit TctC